MNGAVVGHAVGDRRYEGPQAATALAPLHSALPLFVNSFQPSFELSGKRRDGAKVKIILRATLYQRLLADTRTSEEVRRQVTAAYVTLDPVRLLQTIRAAQQELVAIADRPAVTTRQSQPPRNEPHSFACSLTQRRSLTIS